MNFDVDVVDDNSAGFFWVIGRPVFDPQNLFANGGRVLRVAVFHLATNHALDYALLVDFAAGHV